MKQILLFFILILTLFSCSIFKSEKIISSEKKVDILHADFQLESYDLLVSVYSKDNYELQVPLIYLTQNINYSDKNELLEYFSIIDSIIANKSEKSIIYHTSLKFNSDKFSIPALDLFETGDYFIYDTKSKSYVEEVFINWYERIISHMPLPFDSYVLIGDYVFWEKHTDPYSENWMGKQ